MRPDPSDEDASRGLRNRSARRIIRTVLDSDRFAIHSHLAISPATTAEIAERLGFEAEAVRRHLRSLLNTGLVVRHGTARPRARTENVYATDLRAGILDSGELADLPRSLLDEVDLALLRVMYREAAAVAAAGIHAGLRESSIARLPIPVDHHGRVLATEIHRRLLDSSLAEVERSRARVAQSGDALIAASIQQLFLEFPAKNWPLPQNVPESRRGVDLDRVDRVLEATQSFARSILEILVAEPASAGDLAGRLGSPPSKVRYELDRLLDEGLIRVARTRRRRGTLDRVFVLDATGHVLSSGDIAASRLKTEPAFGNWMVRSIFREALEAIRTGTSREHGIPIISRIPTAIDSVGFANVSALMEGAVTELADLHRKSLQASADGRSCTHLMLSGMLLFEQRPDAPG